MDCRNVCEMVNKSVNDIELAKEAAKERGRQYILEFQALPKEQQIETLANLMYVTIHLDPYGYPNGLPHWNELPLIDLGHTIGADQSRYIEAAATVYKMLTWKPNNDTNS